MVSGNVSLVLGFVIYALFWLNVIFLFSGRNTSSLSRGIYKYSTATAVEAPIIPPVTVNHTQLLIDGQFVHAASGKTSQH